MPDARYGIPDTEYWMLDKIFGSQIVNGGS
jgi:hypothetical protein